ncbi:hypothetical protein INR49_022548, partial [Caranx melampygus]
MTLDLGAVSDPRLLLKTRRHLHIMDHAINGLSLLQLLLHLNHQLDTINHQLDLLNLRGAQTTQPGQDLLELGVCAELGQLDVHTTTQASSQVGGAGQDVAQMLVPHEAVVVLLEDRLNLTNKEKSENRPTQKRLKTSFMLPPFCMEMTRRCLWRRASHGPYQH